jgi:galactokinase
MMSLSSTRWPLVFAVTLAALPASSTAASAQDVRVTVMAIHATERNKDVDDDLRDIAEKVQKAEPKLTGFRKGRMTSLTLGIGAKETFELVDDESATVTVVEISKKDKVKLTVKPPAVGAITYTTAPDKFFPIVTRYETKNKERLIVAIMVEQGKQK